MSKNVPKPTVYDCGLDGCPGTVGTTHPVGSCAYRHARLLADYCAGVCDPCEPASTEANDSGRFWADPCPVGFYKLGHANRLEGWGETIWPLDYGQNSQYGGPFPTFG